MKQYTVMQITAGMVWNTWNLENARKMYMYVTQCVWYDYDIQFLTQMSIYKTMVFSSNMTFPHILYTMPLSALKVIHARFVLRYQLKS